jgi:hypothetical protein
MYITDSSSGRTGLLISIHFIRWLLVYNVAIWFTFALIYHGIDFNKHFDVPHSDGSFSEAAYYSWQCTTQMYGTDVVPKTTTGRTLVSIQSFLTYSQFVILLAPWAILPIKS